MDSSLKIFKRLFVFKCFFLLGIFLISSSFVSAGFTCEVFGGGCEMIHVSIPIDTKNGEYDQTIISPLGNVILDGDEVSGAMTRWGEAYAPTFQKEISEGYAFWRTSTAGFSGDALRRVIKNLPETDIAGSETLFNSPNSNPDSQRINSLNLNTITTADGNFCQYGGEYRAKIVYVDRENSWCSKKKRLWYGRKKCVETTHDPIEQYIDKVYYCTSSKDLFNQLKVPESWNLESDEISVLCADGGKIAIPYYIPNTFFSNSVDIYKGCIIRNENKNQEILYLLETGNEILEKAQNSGNSNFKFFNDTLTEEGKYTGFPGIFSEFRVEDGTQTIVSTPFQNYVNYSESLTYVHDWGFTSSSSRNYFFQGFNFGGNSQLSSDYKRGKILEVVRGNLEDMNLPMDRDYIYVCTTTNSEGETIETRYTRDQYLRLPFSHGRCVRSDLDSYYVNYTNNFISGKIVGSLGGEEQEYNFSYDSTKRLFVVKNFDDSLTKVVSVENPEFSNSRIILFRAPSQGKKIYGYESSIKSLSGGTIDSLKPVYILELVGYGEVFGVNDCFKLLAHKGADIENSFNASRGATCVDLGNDRVKIYINSGAEDVWNNDPYPPFNTFKNIVYSIEDLAREVSGGGPVQ